MTSTKTAQLPYADAFVPYVKYCITWVSKDRSKLSCYTGVKFLKNILVKGIVSKAAMKGMQDNLTIFMPIVKNEANKLTHRKRSASGGEKSDGVSLRRGGTIRRPSSKNFSETNAETEQEDTTGWYAQAEAMVSTLRDLVEGLPFAAKVGFAVLVVMWMLYSRLRSGSRQAAVIANPVAPVASRAVYLRDINEGLLHADSQPVYSHSAR